MFSDIKLTTVSSIISLFMLVIIIVISVSASLAERNITLIDSTWQEYKVVRSDKVVLVAALQAEIGYDGMIHDFKNYVLRHNDLYKRHVVTHINRAESIINRYQNLDISQAESSALNDLLIIFSSYYIAVEKIERMISQGHSTLEIDQVVRIDDERAFLALNLLRAKSSSRGEDASTLKPSKSALATDLRASLGYGGMIHLYKDYLLHARHNHSSHYNKMMTVDINKKIQLALNIIEQYEKLDTTQNEKISLENIKNTLTDYHSMVLDIAVLAEQNSTPIEIDHKVAVDDSMAVQGLKVLDREIDRQWRVSAENVEKTINLVSLVTRTGKWLSIAMILIVMAITLWLLRYRVIKPITQLIDIMVKLANDKLDVEVPNSQRHNEIGQMMHSVAVFKKNMSAHSDAEQQLASNNKSMAIKLDDISHLPRLAEEQSKKVLSLAEGMEEAHLSTEKMMHQLQNEKKQVSSILDAVQDCILTMDSYGIIKMVNNGAEQIFDYKSIELVNENLSKIIPEILINENGGHLLSDSNGHFIYDQIVTFESDGLRKNGEIFPVEVTLNPVKTNDKINITTVIRDITARKNEQEKVNLLALSDPLTGLANRHKYNDRLERAIKEGLRFDTQFALLFIDLDNFKPVNDTHGHLVGDRVLEHIAKELSASCRDVDLVARLGGDEFAILAIGLNQQTEVSILAERIIKNLSKLIIISSHEIQVSASIGISNFPQDSLEIEALSRMADEALYSVKRQGRNDYRYYSEL